MVLGEINTTTVDGKSAKLIVYANSKLATKSILVEDHQGDAYITLNGDNIKALIDLLTQV